MTDPMTCPVCTMSEILEAPDHWECATCGHEWPRAREVRDAVGNLLADGDSVTLVKEVKVKGSSTKLKVGTKVKSIRLVDGDHELDCKVEGMPIMLKASLVKKA